MSERSQADYLVRSMVLSQAAGVQKFFWYDFLNDGSDPSKMEQNFGLLRKPDAAGRYTPKPAYTAYASLIRELTGHSFVRRESVIPGVFDMLFTDNVRVLWSTPLRQRVTLATSSPVTVISVTGRTQTLVPDGGRIILNISADPIYIQGPVSNVSWHSPL